MASIPHIRKHPQYLYKFFFLFMFDISTLCERDDETIVDLSKVSL